MPQFDQFCGSPLIRLISASRIRLAKKFAKIMDNSHKKSTKITRILYLKKKYTYV